MQEEALLIFKKSHFIKQIDNKFVKLWIDIKNNNLILITGIGSLNASFALSYVLTKYSKINNIYNIGLAGSINTDYKIGEILTIRKSYSDLKCKNYHFLKILNKKNIPKTNIISSDFFINQNSFNEKIFNFKRMKQKKIYLFDMEIASLSKINHLFNKNLISLKLVSDIIDFDSTKNNNIQFEENMKLCQKKILDFYKVFLCIKTKNQ